MDPKRPAGPIVQHGLPPRTRESTARTVTDRQTVHDRWAALLIVTVSVWVTLPRLIQSVTAPKHLSSVGLETPPLSRLASLASTGLLLVLVGVCLLILVDIAKDARPGPIGGLAVVLAPWIYLSLRDMFLGGHPDKASLMYPLVVGTLWLLRPRVGVLRYVGYVVAAAAVISIALALVLPSKGLLVSTSGDLATEGKAIIPSGILIGFLTHGNNLGQFLALGLPFVAMVSDRRLRWLLLAITSFALIWTAARSILGAVVVGVLAVAVTALVDRASRRWFAPVVVLTPFVIGGVLPFLITNPVRFTNRGGIWVASIDWWQQSPLTGLGSNWYTRVGGTSDRLASSVFNGHNQLIHLLVTGGILLAVLVAVQLVVAAVRSGEIAASGPLVAVGYLGTLAGACVLEKALSIVDNTPMMPVTVIPLTVLICGALTRAPRADTTEPDLSPGPDSLRPAGTP